MNAIIKSAAMAALAASLLLAKAQPSVASVGADSLSAPVAQEVVSRLAAARSGTPADAGGISACDSNPPLGGDGRVFASDVAVSAVIASPPALGHNCLVTFGDANADAPLRLRGTSSFDDAWLTAFSSAGSERWNAPGGTSRMVSTMSRRGVVSIAKYRGFDVLALLFRDRRYCALLVVGSGLSESTAKNFTGSAAFKRGTGYRIGEVNLTMPRVSLSTERTWCVGGCSKVAASLEAALVLNEKGAGDGRGLPSVVGKLSMTPVAYQGALVPGSRDVRIDRPFYVAIVDLSSSSVLLDGFVSRP